MTGLSRSSPGLKIAWRKVFLVDAMTEPEFFSAWRYLRGGHHIELDWSS